MDIVTKDGHIPYKNTRRTGIELILHKIYIHLDVILLIYILASIMKKPQEGLGGGGGMAGMNQTKKF